MEQNQITEEEIARVLEVVNKLGYINWAVCNKELSSPRKATAMLHILQRRGIIQESENGEWTANTPHTVSGTDSVKVITNTDETYLNKEKTMDNKSRKKKVIKWLLIGIGCVVLFAIMYVIDSTIVGYNQSVIMEHRVSGGASPLNTISRGTLYYLIFGIGTLVSGLGFLTSAIMFIVSLISCWITNDSTVVQQVTAVNSDTLVQLSKLYKEGLLTKQEFETKKKQLLGGKQNG